MSNWRERENAADLRQRMRTARDRIDDQLMNNIGHRRLAQEYGLPERSAENIYLDRVYDRRRLPGEPTRMYLETREARRIRAQQAADARQSNIARQEGEAVRALMERAAGPTTAQLIIANAPHIGDLELDLSNGTNALSLDKFVDGEELVRLNHSNLPSYIYKIETLQEWFNTGEISNPLTRENITQDDIERFRYVEKLTKGGKRKGKKSRKGKKVSRKYRKTNRRNAK